MIFFASSASDKDKNLLNNIILEHYVLLSLEMKQKSHNSLSIEEFKAYLLLSLNLR